MRCGMCAAYFTAAYETRFNMVRRQVAVMSLLLIGFAIGVATGAQFSSKPNRTANAKVLVTADLSDICPGKELVVSSIEFGAGDSPKHYHPGHLVSYIVSGSEHVTIYGKGTRILNAGDVEYLKPREPHSTTSTAPVRELAIRVAEKGQSGSFAAP